MNKFDSYQHILINPDTKLGSLGMRVAGGIPGMAYLIYS